MDENNENPAFRAEDMELTNPTLKALADSFGLMLRSWSSFGSWNFAGLFWNHGGGGLVLFVPKEEKGWPFGDSTRLVPLETASLSGKDRTPDSVQDDILGILEKNSFASGGVLTNSDGSNRAEIPPFSSTAELRMKIALRGEAEK